MPTKRNREVNRKQKGWLQQSSQGKGNATIYSFGKSDLPRFSAGELSTSKSAVNVVISSHA
jgi:hypothetical protein